MKRNESGQYGIDDDMFIEDIETGESMVFLLNPEEKLVIRSLLEHDIKPAVNILDVSSSEKRKKMKLLWDIVPKVNSQNYVFVAERIIGNESQNLYENERELIGLGVRENEQIHLTICKHEEKSMALLKMIKQLAKYYGIEGESYFIPA